MANEPLDLQDMMGRVVDELYAGLTGGDAELPLPTNTIVTWIQPGMPFHESEFDFAIAGPYAGPSPLTLNFFRELVETLRGGGDEPDEEDAEPTPQMDPQQALEEAKRMYQTHLLGTWENWSRLVDFIPLAAQTEDSSQWSRERPAGAAQAHTQIVFAQANRTLSQTYSDTLDRCWVADEDLTAEQEQLIERMRALLQEKVMVEDFITGEQKEEIRDSKVMQAYKEYSAKYDNAVMEYGSLVARSMSGSQADVIEYSRTGGILRRRALQAKREWIGSGYKYEVEQAQAALGHILGTSMVRWKENLRETVQDIQDNTTGIYGYPFYPAGVLPGSFARSDGWTSYSQRELHRTYNSTSTSRRGRGSAGFSLGIFSIGGRAGASRREEQVELTSRQFGMSFEYTQVEIVRPGWFNPNFFLSRGWKPKDEFIRDYGTDVHSNGEEPREGAMIGYPTKALFVRNLIFYSRDFASFMKTKRDDVSGGGIIGIGPFMAGGSYSQSTNERESNLDITDTEVRVPGLQLVAFLSAGLPAAANPSPDVQNWV